MPFSPIRAPWAEIKTRQEESKRQPECLDFTIPLAKGCYYDNEALKKRKQRAARAQPQPPYVVDPPAFNTNHDVFFNFRTDEQLRQKLFVLINRPRHVEQLRLPDFELLANELWSRLVDDIVWTRLVDYMSLEQREETWQELSYSCAPSHDALKPFTLNNDSVSYATQQVLAIPELLEAILRVATPEMQLSAYYVSSTWRDVAMFVIGSFVKFSSWSRHAHRPCGPVQFGTPSTYH
jgi:hypothetical protein